MERDLAQQVFERWKETTSDEQVGHLGVHRDPATEAALARFETAHTVTLPESYRQLWRLSDGTGAMDSHEQIFWPIDVVQTILERFGVDDPVVSARLDTPDTLWVGFADYQLQTAVLYLRFDRHGGTTEVWVDTYGRGDLPTRLRCVARTFDGFLERYLEDPLFWRKPHANSA